MREFRRALCYGTDRAGIVNDILLAGKQAAGFVAAERAVSRGRLAQRPGRLRLQPATSRRGPTNRGWPPCWPASPAPRSPSASEAERKERGEDRSSRRIPRRSQKSPPPDPLSWPSGRPVARVACQSIKLQLDQRRHPDQARRAAGGRSRRRRRVRPALRRTRGVGAAGRRPPRPARRRRRRRPRSALMAAALDDSTAPRTGTTPAAGCTKSTASPTTTCRVIPLWQTVNYFARRKWLDGVGDQP